MTKKNKWIILALLTVFYWSSRSINIASDLPKWKTFYYSQVDELFYTIGAFNIVSPADSAYKDIAQNDFLPVNLFEDAVTAASLSVFGNNYLGLRFPSMLMGYFVLLLLFLLLEKRFGGGAAIIAAVLLLLDIGFLLSNRVAEPTIFRLFSMMVVIYILQGFLAKTIRPVHFFTAGFVGCFGFLFFYPTNLFITGATFLFMLLLFVTQKKEASLKYYTWAFYLLSSLLCAGIFLFIASQVMGSLTRFAHMGDFSGRVAVAGEKGLFVKLRTFASNIKALKDASFFYFNPYMLVIGIAAAGYFMIGVYKAFKTTKRVNMDVLVTCFLLLFLCQTVFINDYPRKKLLMLFPFVIYALLYSIEKLKLHFERNRFTRYAYLVLVPVAAWSAFYQYKFVYNKPTFYYRSAMISLQKYNGKLIAGNLSYAFRLYNHYIPLLNYYAYKYHNYEEHQQLLKQLSTDKNFAGSIYFSGEKFQHDLKAIDFCPVENILPVNPNVPPYPIYLDRPCGSTDTNESLLKDGVIN